MALASAVLALIVYGTGALNGLERQTVDARFSIRGTRAPERDIAIVGLDEKSVLALRQRPPIRRIFYAQLLDRLKAAGPRLIAIDNWYTGHSPYPRDDQALLAAVSRDGPVLLEMPDGKTVVPDLAGSSRPPGAIFASPGVDLDPDNVLRRMLYVQIVERTFAVRAAELVRHQPVPASSFPGNHAWVDFHGPPGSFTSYPFADVLSGKVGKAALAGKIVLVGITDPGQKDVFVTAASANPMSGVEFQANALSTILRGFSLKSVPGVINVLALLALAAVPALLSLRLPSLYMLGASVGGVVLFLAVVQLAFDSGRIVSAVDPLFALTLSTAGCVAVDAFLERQQRRRLEAALGRLMPRPTAFFVSYRRDDSRWPANLLAKELTARFGESSVFMDTAAINPGQEFPARIEQAIRGCSAMLVLIGPRWLASDAEGRRRIDDAGDWVCQEVAAGLRRIDAAVVPVLLEGAKMPNESELPEPLKPLVRRNAITLSAERYAAELDEFLDAIQRGLIQDLVARERDGGGAGAPVVDLAKS